MKFAIAPANNSDFPLADADDANGIDWKIVRSADVSFKLVSHP